MVGPALPTAIRPTKAIVLFIDGKVDSFAGLVTPYLDQLTSLGYANQLALRLPLVTSEAAGSTSALSSCNDYLAGNSSLLDLLGVLEETQVSSLPAVACNVSAAVPVMATKATMSVSPAAKYPARYGKMKVQVLSTCPLAVQMLNKMGSGSGDNDEDAKKKRAHLLPARCVALPTGMEQVDTLFATQLLGPFLSSAANTTLSNPVEHTDAVVLHWKIEKDSGNTLSFVDHLMGLLLGKLRLSASSSTSSSASSSAIAQLLAAKQLYLSCIIGTLVPPSSSAASSSSLSSAPASLPPQLLSLLPRRSYELCRRETALEEDEQQKQAENPQQTYCFFPCVVYHAESTRCDHNSHLQDLIEEALCATHVSLRRCEVDTILQTDDADSTTAQKKRKDQNKNSAKDNKCRRSCNDDLVRVADAIPVSFLLSEVGFKLELVSKYGE